MVIRCSFYFSGRFTCAYRRFPTVRQLFSICRNQPAGLMTVSHKHTRGRIDKTRFFINFVCTYSSRKAVSPAPFAKETRCIGKRIPEGGRAQSFLMIAALRGNTFSETLRDVVRKAAKRCWIVPINSQFLRTRAHASVLLLRSGEGYS